MPPKVNVCRISMCLTDMHNSFCQRLCGGWTWSLEKDQFYKAGSVQFYKPKYNNKTGYFLRVMPKLIIDCLYQCRALQ